MVSALGHVRFFPFGQMRRTFTTRLRLYMGTSRSPAGM